MKFLIVVWEAAGPRRPALALAAVAMTLGSLGVLAVVNATLGGSAGSGVDLGGLLLFVLSSAGVVGGFMVGQRLAAQVVEGLLDRVRVRTVDLLRRADYGRLESMGGQSVYDTLSGSSSIMAEAALAAVPGVGAVATLVLGGFYTLMLSPLVFAVIAAVLLSTSFFYRLSQRRTRAVLARASELRARFYALLRHLLDGFKEVKLHDPRGADLEHGHLEPSSAELREAQIDATAHINRGVIISYFFFYLMLGTIAFLLPPLVGDQKVVVKSVYVAVFMLGVVEGILKAVPTLTRASFAVDEIDAVERQLEAAARDEPPAGQPAAFERISGRDLLYSYYDAEGSRSFTMGPTSLEIARGELLFVVGGNGSGKSTLLKTFIRLYQPQGGVLLWDGVPVEPGNVRAYRSLFSSVFSDFHLFDRLYGLEQVPEARVNALLEDLGIAHKTQYRDGRFTHTDLSTGQRKRLALAVALLEERPILVLDELAADQDPEFRQRFYAELVPRWKAEGRTMIIVSHDDRYFHVADRTLILADGRVRGEQAVGAEA